MMNVASDQRQNLLMEVTKAGFALDDAQLFLDTHPCDSGALAYFKQMSEAYKELGGNGLIKKMMQEIEELNTKTISRDA